MFAQDRPAVWSERRDLNPGPPVPQTGALTGLRYAPPNAPLRCRGAGRKGGRATRSLWRRSMAMRRRGATSSE